MIYNKHGIMKAAHDLWVAQSTPFEDRLCIVWKNAKLYMGNGKADGRLIMHKPDSKETHTVKDYYKNNQYTGDQRKTLLKDLL